MFVPYFALHIYNADEFLEERAVKQNEWGLMKKEETQRYGKEGARKEEDQGNASFSGASDHQDTERRAEQQVYIKKALRPLAERYLESERLEIGSQDFQEEKETDQKMSF